jgi:hypothetical protein
VHVSLLIVSLLFIPPLPSLVWRPDRVDAPEAQILFLLLAVVGIPYLVLATTAPLMQVWYARTHPGRSPYRLYGWSNAASLLALLMYPTVFEMKFTVRQQGVVWTVLYVLFALAAFYCARLARASGSTAPSAPAPGAARPAALTRFGWFLLPALASALLLAVTSELSQDVTVMPFLWVLPLAAYLMTFIVSFYFERLYARWFFMPLAIVGLALLSFLDVIDAQAPLWIQIATWLLILFSLCMICHGEIVRRKPEAAHLTLFYLCIAGGGAVGGIFVGVAAPRLFASFLELPLLLGAIPAAAGVLAVVEFLRGHPAPPRRILEPMAYAIFALGGASTAYYATRSDPEPVVQIAQARNFFGVLTIEETSEFDGIPFMRIMYHGRISHGAEFQDPVHQREPLAYYAPVSAVGKALRFHPKQQNRRIGVVGLGVGSLAGYGQAGDLVRFYEINPLSEEFANDHFHFVPRCPCKVEVVPGDARVSLERESGQQYDVLVLDAFSGDAIPVHLLTEEAMRTYLRHLAQDGIVAAHISNWYVDLVRVFRGLAQTFGLHAVMISSHGDEDSEIYAADWVLLTRNPALLERPEFLALADPEWDGANPVHWTDDFNSLLSVVDWGFDTD